MKTLILASLFFAMSAQAISEFSMISCRSHSDQSSVLLVIVDKNLKQVRVQADESTSTRPLMPKEVIGTTKNDTSYSLFGTEAVMTIQNQVLSAAGGLVIFGEKVFVCSK